MLFSFVFFFFSSRRRHTRLTCDWSSDVCSSDLLLGGRQRQQRVGIDLHNDSPREPSEMRLRFVRILSRSVSIRLRRRRRSEERRVGKECRCRGGGDDWKKKKGG